MEQLKSWLRGFFHGPVSNWDLTSTENKNRCCPYNSTGYKAPRKMSALSPGLPTFSCDSGQTLYTVGASSVKWGKQHSTKSFGVKKKQSSNTNVLKTLMSLPDKVVEHCLARTKPWVQSSVSHTCSLKELLFYFYDFQLTHEMCSIMFLCINITLLCSC